MQIVSHFHSREQGDVAGKFPSLLPCCIPPPPPTLLVEKRVTVLQKPVCANVEEFAVYFISETTIAVNPAA